jgi:hypothetical protein
VAVQPSTHCLCACRVWAMHFPGPGPAQVWDWLNQVNAANYDGHSDWRLPSEEGHNTGLATPRELETILNCGSGSPCIDPLFGPTQAGVYWSSTTVGSHPDGAWNVSFNFGGAGSDGKSVGTYVRAVR